ncbi:DUF7848 domain-containing protein [Kitasatospora sp. NPDC054768]
MAVRERLRFRAYHVARTDAPVLGSADCADEAGLCLWQSGEPGDQDAITKAISAHYAESGHTAFRRVFSDTVTVTPGKWDGE